MPTVKADVDLGLEVLLLMLRFQGIAADRGQITHQFAGARIRIPEMTEQRRKEMVKVAHKYAEDARVAVRHVRRDGLDLLKKAEKDGMSQDDVARDQDLVQKATDQSISEIDQILAAKEKEIMQV